jgi:hypothetical protein
LSVFLSALIFGLLGCTSDNPGPPLTIVNGTDQDITVVYYYAPLPDGTRDHQDIATIPPGGVQPDPYLFRLEGRCLHGTVVATDSNGRTWRLDQPCQGDRWVVSGTPSNS